MEQKRCISSLTLEELGAQCSRSWDSPLSGQSKYSSTGCTKS